MRGSDYRCSCKILLYNELHRLNGRRSVVHQPPPAPEQVRPRVGRLDLVLDQLRQRRLDNSARMIRLPVRRRGKLTPWLECAPVGGQGQAAVLTGRGAC